MHTEAQPAAPLHCDTVIVGGGAGGLELAARLGRKFGAAAGPEKLLLIDRSIIHIWKPSLHEVAVGTLNPQQEGLLYTALAQRNHFSFRLGELCGLDPEARTLDLAEWRDDEGVVVVPAMRIHFERCVLAIGSGSNSFGTPGFDKAFVLENVEQAQRFHRHLFGRFLQAANAEHRRLDVAIVGAGATGVELAAEMTEAHREFQTIVGRANRFALNIKLIEAAPRILSALSEKMSAHAVNILQDKQVEIFTSTQVGAIADHGIVTRSGQEIAADIVVWAAGIKAAEANRHFGLQTNAIHQFIVNDRLQTSAPAVYAMGDCAALEVQGVRVPATAQAAHQQAGYLSQRLWAQQQGRPAPDKGFRHADAGSLVALGDGKGVGSVAGLFPGRSVFIQGALAKRAHMSLHLLHHFAVLGFARTGVLALARLLQKRLAGRLKLH